MAYKPKTLQVIEGGSGVVSNTAYAVLTGGTTSTSAIQSIASVGTSGQWLTSNDAGALPTFQDAASSGGSNSKLDYFAEFLTYAIDASGFGNIYDIGILSGANFLGTSSVYAGTGLATNPGIAVLDIGTSSSQSAYIYNGPNWCLFGGGETTVEFLIYIPTLSTATQRYILYIGFGNNDFLGSEYTNGAYFVYSDNINSGNWTMKTAAGGSRTTANSSTAVAATTWTKLKVVVNAAGTSVAFFVNGSEVANSPITTNIPTSTGQETGISALMKRSAGTTARTLWIDYVKTNVNLTTAR